MYPEFALIEGVEYAINTDFKVALECLRLINDDYIDDFERSIGVITMLFGEECLICEEALIKAGIFLSCNKENNSNEKPDMDFVQDQSYVSASFRSTYHIDLSKEDIHFWQFFELVEGLSSDSVLSRVRELRNTDISEISDPNTKRKIIKAKKAVELKREIKNIDDDKKSSFLDKLEKR